MSSNQRGLFEKGLAKNFNWLRSIKKSNSRVVPTAVLPLFIIIYYFIPDRKIAPDGLSVPVGRCLFICLFIRFTVQNGGNIGPFIRFSLVPFVQPGNGGIEPLLIARELCHLLLFIGGVF